MTASQSEPVADGELPRLRALDFRPIEQNGQAAILLRDPLQLSDMIVSVPRQLAPILALCDGTRDLKALRASAIVRYQLLVGMDVLNRLVSVCDEACLLENEHYRSACRERLEEYRAAPYRPPALAGQSYPAEPAELRELLDGYLAEVDQPDGRTADESLAEISREYADGRGLVSPHIDYERGGPVYASVWRAAQEMVRAADLAIILGTDHYGAHGSLTLTRQNYATPFGVLPTAAAIVDGLAESLGRVTSPEAPYAAELHHRNEHSIELAAVWLHHMRGGEACEVVPVLCGSYGHFVAGEADPERDPAIQTFVDVLREKTRGRRAIVVAAGDLAHVGPAFGGEPIGMIEAARLHQADDEMTAHICEGDARGFFQSLKQVDDRNNVCGLPPIYLALRLLDGAEGRHVSGLQVGYDRCPADEQDSSFVTVGGIVLK
jgi:MEMO1 family protein